jgi:transcriptional regulator with XRE-family HTH domain
MAMEVASISGHPGPLVRRRELGAALRQHRIAAGLSLREVADRLLLSQSKLSRLETARRSISARDVRDLLDLYRVADPEIRDRLMKLVEESRESAWWDRYDYDVDPGYARLIGLEGAAATIRDYQIGAVPGLLQTSEYTAAVLSAWIEDPNVIRSAVDLRQARSQHLNANVELEFLVDESVVRRSIGGRETMLGQLRKLITVSAEPSTRFQIVPFSVGAHQGLVGGFIVLHFPDSNSAGASARMSDIVYHEGVVGAGTYLEQPDEVAGYREAFRRLQSQALTERATTLFMEQLIRDL